jgi:hypothetical protein
MRTAGLVALLLGSTTVASAGVTAGVDLGLTQAKDDGNADSSHTLGVFGRLGFTPRLAGQLELQKIDTGTPNVDIRTVTGLLVVDLGDGGRLMPMILAGIGIDHAGMTYGSVDGHHLEGGFSLEYRADGGFTIGAGFRLGGRSIDSDSTIVPLANVALYVPQTIREGEYRSAGIYAAVRF